MACNSPRTAHRTRSVVLTWLRPSTRHLAASVLQLTHGEVRPRILEPEQGCLCTRRWEADLETRHHRPVRVQSGCHPKTIWRCVDETDRCTSLGPCEKCVTYRLVYHTFTLLSRVVHFPRGPHSGGLATVSLSPTTPVRRDTFRPTRHRVLTVANGAPHLSANVANRYGRPGGCATPGQSLWRI